MMRLPAKEAPSRHMVEPQSPLHEVRTSLHDSESTYQKLEVTSFPLSLFTVCCFGVPLVTLKPSSE